MSTVRTAEDLYAFLATLRQEMAGIASRLRDPHALALETASVLGDELAALVTDIDSAFGEPAGRAVICLACGAHFPLSDKQRHERNCVPLIAGGYVQAVVGGPDNVGFREGL